MFQLEPYLKQIARLYAQRIRNVISTQPSIITLTPLVGVTSATISGMLTVTLQR